MAGASSKNILALAMGTLCALLVACVSVPAIAAAGFGLDEREALDLSTSSLQGAVATPGGGILLLGSFTRGEVDLVRLRPDGSLDRSFSGDGRLPVEFAHDSGDGGQSLELVTDVAVQSNGDIVVVGGRGAYEGVSESSEMLVARFRPDGGIDRSFGKDGTKVISFDQPRERATTVAIAPDGKIVIGGFSGPTTTRPDVTGAVIARLLPDGSYDPSFSGDGRASLEGGRRSESGSVSDVAVLPSEKVVAMLPGEFVAHVTRLRANGTPDSSFGEGGQADVAPPAFDPGKGRPFEPLRTMGVLPSGAVTIAGTVYRQDPRTDRLMLIPSIAAISLRPDGHLNRRFGKGGVLTIRRRNTAQAFAIQPSGRFIVSGGASASKGSFPAFCFTPKGVPDARFGHNGRADVSFQGRRWTDRAQAIVFQGSARVVFAGSSVLRTKRSFVRRVGLARLRFHQAVR